MSITRLGIATLLTAFCFLGCRKDNTPTTPTPTGNKFVFDLTGAKSSMAIENTGSDSMDVKIARVSGSSEKINLSVEGLPSGAKAIITPDNGLPPFTSHIVISANGADTGTYNAILKATGATAGVNSYPINLRVFSVNTACVSELEGRYSVYELCEGSQGNPYNANVVQDPTDKKKIIIKNFAGLADQIDVSATIVCGSKAVIIPEQKIKTNTVSGNGSFSDNKLTINYTLTSTATATIYTTTCTAVYSRF